MKAVVMLSGGMDSAVLLADLLSQGYQCSGVTVDYAQRHSREIDSARAIAKFYSVEHRVMMVRGLTGGVLLDLDAKVPHGHYEEASMLETVVPARNMLLLSLAASAASAQGVKHVAYGAHAGDHAIYADCRPEFVKAMRQVLNLDGIELLAPYISWKKGQIAERGKALNVPFGMTWSCYEGKAEPCGKCGTCVERREAFGQ